MKILWITNTIFPAVCNEIGISVPVVGGWMYSSAKYLIDTYKDVQLGVATIYNGSELKTLQIGGIDYFLLPISSKRYLYDKKLEGYWKEINHQFNPSLVHIHGSEYPHGLAYVNACGNENVIVSIQGLVSVIERYYLGNIEIKELKKHTTIRDIIKNDSLLNQRKRLKVQGSYEKLLLKGVQNVLGRTAWDKTHTWGINPEINYYLCNETLRSEFYNHSWDYETCEKHSIFLSQAHYPLKGLQQVIKALPYILRKYPDTLVYVAGNNFISANKWKLNGFGKYIRNLIHEYGVSGKIIFTGILSESEMCKRYLKSNVFVCPSSIENSPNSVGEAQLLGVPCVASFVGGSPDMIAHEQTGLIYRFDEFEMLATNVIRIFDDRTLAERLSIEGQKAAKLRHSKTSNTERLYSIYQEICRK